MRWLLVVGCAMLVLAPAAQAKKWFGGTVPDLAQATHLQAPSHRARIANLPYEGGPVLHSNRTHAIFWQPQGSGLGYDPGYISLVETFLADVATDSHKPTNPYGLSGQYSDSFGPAAYNSSFGGGVLVTNPLPGNGCAEPMPPPLGTGPGWGRCLSDQQLENELSAVVSGDHLPQSSRDVYFLVLPNGLGTCEFGGPSDCSLGGSSAPGSFCGYHSATPDGLLYAVIPYNAVPGHCQSTNPRPNASTADPTISTISHEHNETVTDPRGDGWIDNTFSEDGDLCISQFGPAIGGIGDLAWNTVVAGHHYYLQEEWSNADGGCEQSARPEALSFAAQGRARAGVNETFTARGSGPQARIVSFDWWFGDNRTGHGRLTKHVYAKAGTYRVVVRATDSWDNWTLSAKTLRVGSRPAKRHTRRR